MSSRPMVVGDERGENRISPFHCRPYHQREVESAALEPRRKPSPSKVRPVITGPGASENFLACTATRDDDRLPSHDVLLPVPSASR